MTQITDPRFVALADATNGEWSTVLTVWNEFRGKYNYHLHTEVESDRHSFLRQAYWLAYGGGHLRALLNRLAESGVTSDSLNDAAAPLLGTGFNFQSYVNGEWTPQNALIGGRRLMQACDHVCRIAIDGKHRGSGILIRPNVVATAGHVIARLLTETGQSTPDSLKRLEITFFDADDLLADGAVQTAKPITASLHQQWLIHYSPPAPNESDETYAIDCTVGIAAPDGPWDLALVRLSAPPRAGLSGHRMRRASLREETGVHILHHPGNPMGAPMGLLWSIGTVTDYLGEPTPLRWLHNANTDGGSSGAPCFDTEWRVVALHQAGPKVITTTPQRNRAVPIYAWADNVDHLLKIKDIDPTPYLTHALDENRVRTPVFGRKLLQARAWRTMTDATQSNEQLFVIQGPPRSGKTFTGCILAELAQQAGCRITSLDVRNMQTDSVPQFVQRILGSLGTSSSGAVLETSGLTTVIRNLQNELLPGLLREIEQAAADKPLWIVLDGLEICDASAAAISQVVEGLISGLKSAPHLKLVLIGWKGTVDTRYLEILSSAPQITEIVEHLWLTLAPPGFEPPEGMPLMLSSFITQTLRAQPPGEPYARAIAVVGIAATTIRSLLSPYIHAAPQGETG